MSLTSDVIAVGVAGVVIVLAGYLAKKKLEEMSNSAVRAVKDAWDGAVTATNDTVFGEGQTINSTIPLYNKELKNRPADYDPGDINSGAIF
ncbi:hypothetical protein GTP23_12135 [Pseudoduganella sp. FT93W]|uniref:Uncharacterized protein n=1 Tax=Duganella fentianensis TaxID=2692177 RepID=A0A845I3J8_9BURK|nr:hypothetical protein [Duganella fentianensis]MYN45796.1 hypothetical protein [Duganella fentianensis]